MKKPLLGALSASLLAGTAALAGAAPASAASVTAPPSPSTSPARWP